MKAVKESDLSEYQPIENQTFPYSTHDFVSLKYAVAHAEEQIMNPYQASGVTYKTYMEYVELCALLSSTQVVEESRTRLAPAHQATTQGCQRNPTEGSTSTPSRLARARAPGHLIKSSTRGEVRHRDTLEPRSYKYHM